MNDKMCGLQKMNQSVFQGRVLSVSIANVKKEEYKKMGMVDDGLK